MTTPPRLQLADELLRRFAATLRSAQLYSKGHPIIARNLESLATALQLLHSLQPSIVVGLVADEVIVDDMDLERALERLPEGCREAFVLHDVEGFDHKEVGALLGIAEGTSKSQVFKARAKLRAMLRRY